MILSFSNGISARFLDFRIFIRYTARKPRNQAIKMQQNFVFLILGITLFLFIWGRLRYDLVALMALLVLAIFKVIPAQEAFTGFGNPAVITVAAVMIISQGLQNSGLIDLIARKVLKLGNNMILQIFVLCSITAIASAFMNNVGAIAIMMPVAIKVSRENHFPSSRILMPLAFSSILGGMITLIGTPPNIIISTFRNHTVGSPFQMFDFSLVGLLVTLTGILFITLIGWRFLPKRKSQNNSEELFQIEDYITEVRVLRNSKWLGKKLSHLEKVKSIDVNLLGLIRQKKRIHTPDLSEVFKTNDILILEADPESIKELIDISGFKLLGGKQFRKDAVGSKDISSKEVIVMNGSKIIGKTASELNFRTTFGLNLLALARSDQKIRQRLDHIRFKVGDVLLIQGRTQVLEEMIYNIGSIPLEEKGLRIGYQKNIVLSLSIFITAILLSITGIIEVFLAFSLCAFLMIVTGIIPIRNVYKNIDWDIIILLGAMIPVGSALETSGGAQTIANFILSIGNQSSFWIIMAVVMMTTMSLSNVINNAATAVLMAPIGILISQNLNLSADPLLMVIAIGASSPFLTPIGHQSNTLVMGPGGYKFSDYWRMGLPLHILILLLSIPAILLVWKP